jgi:hypothetical protein
MEIVFNDDGWDEIVKEIIDTEGVTRMQRVADACNESDGLTDSDPGGPGYRVDVDGGKPLDKHDYRATVITATNQAMFHNAVNNTLVRHLNQAAGD